MDSAKMLRLSLTLLAVYGRQVTFTLIIRN
jgi:hypothetical protein